MLDTNVIVSSVLALNGIEARVVDLAIRGVIQMFVSAGTLAEYESVLQRPKFRRAGVANIQAALRRIRRAATLAIPKNRLNVSPDENDNRFLECAEAAKAHFLITGNRRHFPSRWGDTRVVSAREFVILLATGELPAD